MTMTQSGMLIPNAQRHEKLFVSQPPSSGPSAAVPPMVAPQTPKAMPRYASRRNVALSRDSEVGSIMAPPMPCRAGLDQRAAARATAASTLQSPKPAPRS